MSATGIFNEFLPTALRETVGNGLTNHPGDIRNVKRTLSRLGYFDDDTENDYITRDLDRSIRNFQRDNGLRADGVLRPGGETERAVQRDLWGFGQNEKPASLRLSDTVGNNKINNSSDVTAVQKILGTLSHVSPAKQYEPSGVLDMDTISGIKAFQKQENLTIDGWLAPGGETETALNISLRLANAQDSNGENGDSAGDGGNNDSQPPIPPHKPEPPQENGPPTENDPEEPPEEEPDCSEQEAALEQAEGVLQAIEQEKSSVETAIEPLEGEIQTIDSQIEEKQQEKDKIEGWIMGLGTAAGALAGGLSGLAITKNPGAARGAAGAGAAAGAERGHALAEAMMTRLDVEIALLQKKRDELAVKLETLQVKLAELETAASNAQTEVDAAQSALESCQGEH